MKKANRIYKILLDLADNEFLVLFAILFVGFLLRLYKIDNPIADWHSWRQADTASVSRIFMDQGIDLLRPRYYDISTAQSGIFNPNGWRMVEFPIYNLIHSSLATMFSTIDLNVWGRLVSVFSSLTTAIFLFLIGKEISNKRVGLLTAFFYMTIPFNIFFTRVVLPEPMAVMFVVVSVWLGLKYIKKLNFYYLNLSALFLALALLVKPYSVFLYLPIVFLIIEKQGYKSIVNNKKYYISVLIAVIPFLLWRLWISQYPEGIPFWKWAFNGDGIRFRPSFWRWIFAERIGNMILGVWGVVILIFGILENRFGKFTNYFLLGSTLFLIVVATANVKHDYYQTFIIPPISLGLALGMYHMWQVKYYNKFVIRSMLMFSIFMMMSFGVYQIKDLYQINHYVIIEAGERVQKLTDDTDLIIAPYNGDTAFLYQTRRFGWPVVDRSIPELIEKGASYYVSVNYDDLTNELMKSHDVIEKNDDFVIIKLNK